MLVQVVFLSFIALFIGISTVKSILISLRG